MAFKVMTIVGTRPEIIKLSRVIYELDRCVTHVLVHTGQNFDYELNEIFFRELGIRKPDHFLDAATDTPAGTISNVISGADRVLAEEKPDALLLLGDTNSCLAVISAKRRKVPVFHMEAGNRCFDERVPEEINRRIIDHASDINLPYTEHARKYLLAEGLRAEAVIKTGSPMREILDHYMPKIKRSGILRKLKLIARKTSTILNDSQIFSLRWMRYARPGSCLSSSRRIRARASVSRRTAFARAPAPAFSSLWDSSTTSNCR
jgi:UDP-N-acetylglucosamine 2-epimerase